MGKEFDPWAAAAVMGLRVIERRLYGGRRGEYWHGERLIALAPGMTQREARSVLTHELQHASRGDTPSPFGLISSRQELSARRGAALALIDADEYAEAERLRGPHLPSIAYELNVSIHVVEDWIALQAAMVAV